MDNPEKAQEISKLQNASRKIDPACYTPGNHYFPDLIEMTLEESSDEASLLALNEDYARLFEEFTKLNCSAP